MGLVYLGAAIVVGFWISAGLIPWLRHKREFKRALRRLHNPKCPLPREVRSLR